MPNDIILDSKFQRSIAHGIQTTEEFRREEAIKTEQLRQDQVRINTCLDILGSESTPDDIRESAAKKLKALVDAL